MKNIKKKIIGGVSVLACTVLAVSIISAASRSTAGDTVPTFLPTPDEPPVIVLDAGHGGFDGGCVSAEGVPEKGINLSILLRLRDLLELNGYTVQVTRDSDRSIHDDGVEGLSNQKSSDMDNRLALFNANSDAVCVSIHQNQFTDPVYSGAQMFYAPTNKRSEALAQSLQNRFRTLQPNNTRETKLCGKELFLCYYSENPTVMAECGFLSNPEEAALLCTEEYQEKIALTLFFGINDYISSRS